MSQKVKSDVSVEITSPFSEQHGEGEKNLSLNFEINSEDNGGATRYVVGTSYKARLYKGKDITEVSVFNTNGDIGLSSKDKIGAVGEDDNEYLVFENEISKNLNYPYAGNFSYEIIGDAYDANGNKISITLSSPAIRGYEVVASERCYAVAKVSYDSYYDEYTFNSNEGKAIITAIAPNESAAAPGSISIEVSSGEEGEGGEGGGGGSGSGEEGGGEGGEEEGEEGEGEEGGEEGGGEEEGEEGEGGEESEGGEGGEGEESRFTDLQFDLVDEDNDNPDQYEVGTSYFIRLYKEKDVTNLRVFNTNGKIALKKIRQTHSVEETITISGDKVGYLSYPYLRYLHYEVVGKVYDKNGDEISILLYSPRVKTKRFTTNKKCYAVIKVSYTTFYDKYIFSGEVGENVLTAISDESEDSYLIEIVEAGEEGEEEGSSSLSSMCSCSTSSSIKYTDVTLSFADFVTGEPIEGAKVYVDGQYKGTTDANGKILVKDLKINVKHDVKATKEGYLDTDSDSLANDKFIIEL